MNGHETELDRSEAATPFKLKKARERGQAARSQELVTAAVFLAAMSLLAAQGTALLHGLSRIVQHALARATAAPEAPEAWVRFISTQFVVPAAALLLPSACLLLLVGLGANLAQTGFIFSFHPLRLDLGRIHPASGLGRVFSIRTAVDAARALLKLALLGAVTGLTLSAWLPQLPQASGLSAAAFAHSAVQRLSTLGLRLGLALALLALLDLVCTRWQFHKGLRMSRRELKDETRQREGDPRIRARMRTLRREALKRSLALRHTRRADVVLTNPTHLAVALRYAHGEMDAPVLVAKGAGALAAAMREIAWRHRIPVVRNASLARRLFRSMDIEQSLPAGFHAEVARIIVWVLALREQQGRARQAAAV